MWRHGVRDASWHRVRHALAVVLAGLGNKEHLSDCWEARQWSACAVDAYCQAQLLKALQAIVGVCPLRPMIKSLLSPL